MSLDLVVHRMHARYLLAPSETATRARLDGVLGELGNGPLERALERRGLDDSAEICVRAVSAPVRLGLAATDAALAEQWAEAIAAAIAAAIRGGGAVAGGDADIVVYRTRAGAVADLVRRAAAGDLARAWAWQRLGLWPARDVAPGDAVSCAVATLRAEPAVVAAVVADLAAAELLAAVARRLSPHELTSLAEAALAAVGVRAETTAAAAQRLREAQNARQAARADAAGGAADGTIERTEAPRAGAASQPPSREPRVANAPALRAATTRAGRALVRAGVVHDAESAIAAAALALVADDPAVLVAAVDAAALLAATAEALASPDRSASAEAPARDRRPPAEAQTAPAADTARDTAEPAAEPAANEDEPHATERAARELARTAEGGLLFLVHVLDELELPAQLAEAEPLARRSVRWSLHRLALLLRDLDADDPAALAFAGLRPEDEPPSFGEPAPTRAELDVLEQAVARVVARLRRRLRTPPEEADAAVLAFTCARAAEVVTDPGWIELRFAAEDASTEIRLALLDLDPGWVPWLGAVVRFVYV